MSDATPRARTLTPKLRKWLGLPAANRQPYRWSFAVFFVAVGSIPMIFAGWWYLAITLAIVALGVVPLIRALEHRHTDARETLYHKGKEAVARVIDVEPGGAKQHDRTVRVEFFADRVRIAAPVMGSPLARRGLRPGDDVVIVYDPASPQHCLLIERVVRGRTSEKEGGKG